MRTSKATPEERAEQIEAVMRSQPGYGFLLATRGLKDERRPSTFTYFIQVEDPRLPPPGPGGPIKIGCAGDPNARLLQLQTACPYELRLLGYVPGGQKLEKELHKKYAHLRLRNEWFDTTEDLEHDVWLMIYDNEE